nr:Sui1 family protein [Vibrio virus CTXphi] [Affertcholeramvirus CTXphi]
KVKLAGG